MGRCRAIPPPDTRRRWQIISVAPDPTGYRAISNSGAWWLVGPDGGIEDQGNLDPDQVLLGVYEHPIGGILVHSVSEVLWFDHRLEPMAIISTNGPLRDAQWDDDVGWRITGWRQDLSFPSMVLRWPTGGISVSPQQREGPDQSRPVDALPGWFLRFTRWIRCTRIGHSCGDRNERPGRHLVDSSGTWVLV